MRGVTLTDQQILGLIRDWVAEHGHSPSMKEWSETAPISVKPLKSHFGSYNKAILAAGFEPVVRIWSGSRRWSDDEILEALRQKAEQLGRSPSGDDLKRAGDHPTLHTVIRHFGTLNNALKKAGLPIRYVGQNVTRRGQGEQWEFVGWAFDNRKGEHAELKESRRMRKIKHE